MEKLSSLPHPPILGAFYNSEQKIFCSLILNRLFLNNVKVASFGYCRILLLFANICTLSFYSFETYRGIDCILVSILDLRITLSIPGIFQFSGLAFSYPIDVKRYFNIRCLQTHQKWGGANVLKACPSIQWSLLKHTPVLSLSLSHSFSSS